MDILANIVGVLFDFGTSQASTAVEVAVLGVFPRINVFSGLLSIVNYPPKRCGPGPERLDFGFVLDARTAVEFFEAEVVHLVNEQNYCVGRGCGVFQSKWRLWVQLQRLVWIGDIGKGEEFLPGLGDVGLGLQDRFLGAHFPHGQHQLQFGFSNQAVGDLDHRGELVVVLFFHPGLSEPVECITIKISKSISLG